MDGKPGALWVKVSAAAAFVAAAGCAVVWLGSGSDWPVTDVLLVSSLVVAAAWWVGALAGGLAGRIRHGRGFTDPMFGGRFGWYYRRGFWFRFGLIFSAGWAAFVVLGVLLAVALGRSGDARAFFTPKGLLAVSLFVVVFWLEGAVVGGIIDIARRMARKE